MVKNRQGNKRIKAAGRSIWKDNYLKSFSFCSCYCWPLPPFEYVQYTWHEIATLEDQAMAFIKLGLHCQVSPQLCRGKASDSLLYRMNGWGWPLLRPFISTGMSLHHIIRTFACVVEILACVRGHRTEVLKCNKLKFWAEIYSECGAKTYKVWSPFIKSSSRWDSL